jgi:hypothetical protein
MKVIFLPNPPINDAIKAANTRLALLIEEADKVVAYQEAEVRPTVLREIRRKANDVITNMRGVIGANPLGLDAVLLTRSEEARVALAAVKLLFDRTLAGTSGGDSSLQDASIQSTGAAASRATALSCARQELDFFLDQLSDEKFIEAGQGSVIPADQLRHVHHVTVPEVSHLIDRCRKAVSSYSSMRGADETVATNALRKCERAYLWTRRVIALFRQEDLHLGSNAPSRDPSFTAFKPGSGISVYEFFMRFEEWARGYLPADARARILYSKYLDKTILSGHKELETIKGNYAAMKRWLISEYGSIRTVSDMYVQSIHNLKPPKASDDQGAVAYHLRSIHHSLTSLASLQTSPGVAVPRLRDHLESNSFLMQLFSVLPYKIREDWSKSIIEQGSTILRPKVGDTSKTCWTY